MKKIITIVFIVAMTVLLGVAQISYAEISPKSTNKVDIVNPTAKTNPSGAFYPGFRGGNQLIIYTKTFGETTGTNEYGTEITVSNNIVIDKNGSNSLIPANGFVISGHGSAKKWLNNNTMIGSRICYDSKTKVLTVVTDASSYFFRANDMIKMVEESLTKTKCSSKKNEAKKLLTLSKCRINKAKSIVKSDAKKSIELANQSYGFAEQAYYNSLSTYTSANRGVWLRPTEKTVDEINQTLDKISNIGINTVYLETFYHGYTVYPSDVMSDYGFSSQNPNFTGIDLLKEWINAAHSKKMKVIPWIETFYVGNSSLGPILSQRPEWGNIQLRNVNLDTLQPSNVEQGAFFMDPANPDVKEFLILLISEMVTKYDVDGINLDYIRYPNCLPRYFPNYESSTWGYTSIALAEFAALYNENPLNLTKNDDLWKKWEEYRQEKVSTVVQAIHSRVQQLKPKVKLSAVVFPDIEEAKERKNQNWVYWINNGYIDVLTPIILGSSPQYVYNETKDIKQYAKKGKVDVYIGIFGAFNQDIPVTFIQQFQKAVEGGADGINIFDYKHLEDQYVKALKIGPYRG